MLLPVALLSIDDDDDDILSGGLVASVRIRTMDSRRERQRERKRKKERREGNGFTRFY